MKYMMMHFLTYFDKYTIIVKQAASTYDFLPYINLSAMGQTLHEICFPLEI